MFCAQCGKELGQAKFCTDCGNPADQTGVEAPAVASPHTSPIDVGSHLKSAQAGVGLLLVGVKENKVNLTTWGLVVGLAYGLMVHTSGIKSFSFFGIIWNFSLGMALKNHDFSDYFVIFIFFPAIGAFIGNRLQKLIVSK